MDTSSDPYLCDDVGMTGSMAAGHVLWTQTHPPFDRRPVPGPRNNESPTWFGTHQACWKLVANQHCNYCGLSPYFMWFKSCFWIVKTCQTGVWTQHFDAFCWYLASEIHPLFWWSNKSSTSLFRARLWCDAFATHNHRTILRLRGSVASKIY